MSKLYASAHSGTVSDRSKLEIIRSRSRSPRTALKIGSWKKSGSPGKYICVTSRVANAVPNSDMWMCAARQAFSWLLQGYAPGLIVMKR
jgi:hypothetical protein